MRRYASVLGIVIGVAMLAMGAMFFASGQVPEVETEPIRISFHLAGEIATALLLVVAGAGLAARRAWARSAYLVAGGMLLYTVIVSPGYFAQRGEWPFVVMFAAIIVTALVAIVGVARMGGAD